MLKAIFNQFGLSLALIYVTRCVANESSTERHSVSFVEPPIRLLQSARWFNTLVGLYAFEIQRQMEPRYLSICINFATISAYGQEQQIGSDSLPTTNEPLILKSSFW